MTRLDPAGEPSMEEILASIRRIIAEDPPGTRPQADAPVLGKKEVAPPAAETPIAAPRVDPAPFAMRDADPSLPRMSPTGKRDVEAIPQAPVSAPVPSSDIDSQLADVLGSVRQATAAPAPAAAPSSSASVQAALDSLMPPKAELPRAEPELPAPQPRAGFTFTRDGYVPPAEPPTAKNEPDPFEFSLGPSPFARAPAGERAETPKPAKTDPFGAVVPARDVLEVSAPSEPAGHELGRLVPTPSAAPARSQPDFGAMSSLRAPFIPVSETPVPIQPAPQAFAPTPTPQPAPEPFAATPPKDQPAPQPAATPFNFSPLQQAPAATPAYQAEPPLARPGSSVGASLSDLAPPPSVWPAKAPESPVTPQAAAPAPVVTPAAAPIAAPAPAAIQQPRAPAAFAAPSAPAAPIPQAQPQPVTSQPAPAAPVFAAPPQAAAQPQSPASTQPVQPAMPTPVAAPIVQPVASPAPVAEPAAVTPPAPAVEPVSSIPVSPLPDGSVSPAAAPVKEEIARPEESESLAALQQAPAAEPERAVQTEEAIFEEALHDDDGDGAAATPLFEAEEASPRALVTASSANGAAPPGAHDAGAARTMEDTVAELLRPMLRNWLAENMPRIVERALRKELDDSSRAEHKPAAE